jgi:hypothetical protein
MELTQTILTPLKMVTTLSSTLVTIDEFLFQNGLYFDHCKNVSIENSTDTVEITFYHSDCYSDPKTFEIISELYQEADKNFYLFNKKKQITFQGINFVINL